MARLFWLAALTLAVGGLVFVSGASAGGGSDFGANVGDGMLYSAPWMVDSVSSAASLNGTWDWDFEIEDYGLAATNPMIEVNSSYPISDFPGLNGIFSGFPVFGVAQATLNPGESYFPGLNLGQSTLPVTFATGYDATRSVSPTTIPAGGATQQVTVTVTAQQAVSGFKISVDGGVENATFVSSSPPSNLGQGEILGGNGANLFLLNPVVDKAYTFGFTLSVPNPYGTPFVGKPDVNVVGQNFTGTCCTTTNSLTVSDPLLNGQVTYSVDQTGSWQINHFAFREIQLLGISSILPPTSTAECKNGGWQLFGNFKNQGDCVSYVATGGKNPPNG